MPQNLQPAHLLRELELKVITFLLFRKYVAVHVSFSISDILENEMYKGNMVQGKYGSVSFRTKKNKPRPKDKQQNNSLMIVH